MKTQVAFRSKKFPPYEGEEEQINPGLWGRRLAEYLVEKLAGLGIETHEIVPEDWGWYVSIKSDDSRVALCCGHQDGADDEFVCFTHPARPIVRKLFRRVDVTAELTRLVAALEEILASDPDITAIEWTEIE